MVRVKYCGITNIEDAVFASRLGVSALGFVFTKSKRRISREQASDISDNLGPFVSKGGVFVNEQEDVIVHTSKHCRLNFIQLHGNESKDYIENLAGELKYQNINVQIIKAFKVKDKKSVSEVIDFSAKANGLCDAYLLDAHSEKSHGGTGKTFNWEYFNSVRFETSIPLILAGGLNPENVFTALQKTNSIAVDVSSGIESRLLDETGDETGTVKDKLKMKEFIDEVWRWQRDVFW